MALLNSIFGAGNFSPHGFCVSWNPLLIWTEAISDSLIAAAYFSIPVVLSIFLMRRHDLVFPWVFALFGSFILLCGATHVLGAVTFWFPAYGIEAILKVLTAIVSIVTAIALWPLLPRALALPSPAALRAANDTLATEVEQRKEAEQSMRSLNDALKAQAIEGRWREHRFQLFMEAVADCAIIMLDTDGIVVSWNTGAGYLKGYMDSEIVGRHFSAFYTDADKVAGKPAQGLEIAAARGRFSDEVWRVRKDGSQFWAGVVITAIRDEHDKLLGFGIVTHDLTDRQHQQRRLTDANLELERRVLERTASLSDLTKRLESEIQERREATELLEKTFDATPLPMMISDAKSNVLMWNKAGEKTFGFTQAEMIEGGFGLLVADGGQAETNRVREAARRGQVTLMPRIRHRDGHMLDLHIIVTPLFRADGAIRATVTMLEDLTQRNLIDAQLRQSQKMEAIGTLTGGMAHDFNNLLGIIIGNLDMLRDARANDPDIDELAGEALDAAMRGAELTRSLLVDRI
jgi:PAS domain S-box-containing protein